MPHIRLENVVLTGIVTLGSGVQLCKLACFVVLLGWAALEKRGSVLGGWVVGWGCNMMSVCVLCVTVCMPLVYESQLCACTVVYGLCQTGLSSLSL